MYNELDFVNLMRNMAIEHPKLMHVDHTHVSFIGINEGERNLYTEKSLGRYVMDVIPARGKWVGDDDALMDELKVGFSIMTPKSKGNAVGYRESEVERTACMVIGKQICARLVAYANNELEDGNVECACCLSGMRGASVEYVPVVDSGWEGYMFLFTIGSGEVIEYNENDWK